ncbi:MULTISPECIES: carotenoid oxygenase family protein [Streptomyces]|uniref:Dioxygenase n=1 Tax=Streptomyces flaveolus TaxID=67297 RepID=A0ABV3ADB2_9ACTN|nr:MULTISPECIES: carotenoid oxygenase family protein [Streptomyces]KMS89136.1 dioxygenase [Streptomyces regensis]KOG64821.1 dioxygenase [Streptomyces antibioticus]MBG7698011.1 carotenoid oxygenase family protein [Streptomyces sp. MC1]
MSTKPYLTGHYEPVADEISATALPVEGTLPPELTGRLIRNSHNPKPGVTPSHWFKGSGMVHGIRLREGRAEWYRNRWVRTPALDGAPYLTERGPDLTASTAGTHVIEHAGRLLALCEANLPFELTAELETVGAHDFGGKLRSAMTAHPKTDPVTGELHFFGSSPFPPYLMYYVADAKGHITHSAEVPGATASLKHDFALTRHHVVFVEGTVTFDPDEHSGIPYGWNDAQPARIGVMPRGGDGADRIRWFPVRPGNMLHAANAYEDERGRIVLEGPTVDREGFRLSWNWWVGAPGRGAEPNARSYTRRWVIDLAAGSVDEQTIDDLAVEFPTLNEDYLGAEHRYQYAVSFPDQDGIGGYGIVKYDRRTGARRVRPTGDARLPSEAVFVPAAGGTAEDDGYLLTVVSDLKQDASRLLVLDAVGLGQVAAVDLPRRVTAGIHGSWIPDSALDGDDGEG